MKKYRIEFNGKNSSKRYDVVASNIDDAFKLAYSMPEASQYHIYGDIGIEEIPEGPSVIGIKFRYTDTVFKKEFTDYIHIKAKDEADAVRYYNENFKGKRFWFNAGKTEDDGKCIRGDVIETFFSAGAGFAADATVK